MIQKLKSLTVDTVDLAMSNDKLTNTESVLRSRYHW